jgi:NDP-sugar pyrophosphorylase family protein
MTVAAILVGGKGTRLRPVISNLPKPLAPVNGECFLYLLLREIKNAGIDRVVLLTGYMHDEIVAACGDGRNFNLKIDYSQEFQALGTAGALKNAQNLLQNTEHFLLLNGDSYYPGAIATLHRTELASHETGLIAVSQLADNHRFGSIQFDPQNGAIQTFKEKHSQKQGFVSAGIYKFNNAILDYIAEKTAVSLEEDVFPNLLAQGNILRALVIPGHFVDIGLPESYQDFCKNMESDLCNRELL